MSQKDQITQLLKEKSVMKQNVYRNTKAAFEQFKTVVNEICDELKEEAKGIDHRIHVDYDSIGDYQVELKVAGDVLVFYMHTNVFEFDKSHPMFKTGYVKENHNNSYCGIIYVYNFLSDSFKYNRLNDLGYLIARIFVNQESRFFVESKPNLGFKYQNFSPAPISKEAIKDIVNELIIYCISFDLYTPPTEAVKEISLNEIQERIQSDKLKTGKRLGFRFQNDATFGDDLNF
ncbi:MAG: hypothetical protein Q8M29_09975 [Bacteroidota bacterium]|nr:hypothetical protein [Bacteroidota bacterium]